MRHTAVIDGHRYTWLESLKMIDCEDAVICQSESGAKLACHSDVWEAHEENAMFSFPDAKVKNKSSSSEKISLFRFLFCGRGDVYAKRWYNLKTGQAGYSPACKNEWQRGICDKRATPCGRCPNHAFLPLTDSVIY